ncbi:hypothetical protein NFJ02_34g85930 [Pycnococcus provasolii]
MLYREEMGWDATESERAPTHAGGAGGASSPRINIGFHLDATDGGFVATKHAWMRRQHQSGITEKNKKTPSDEEDPRTASRGHIARRPDSIGMGKEDREAAVSAYSNFCRQSDTG